MNKKTIEKIKKMTKKIEEVIDGLDEITHKSETQKSVIYENPLLRNGTFCHRRNPQTK